jgi:AcrR family transcriptional regulator
MRSLLLRWADQISTRYELDDQQRAAARKQVLDQWEPFLEAHRRRIQPLANEFLEMRLGVEPPAREHVQAWAKRAIPVLEEVRRHVDQGSGRFRELLQPGQRIKFEADALGMTAGMALAEQTLRRWKDGDYDEQQIWHPTSRGGESPPVARENTASGSADGQEKPDEESSSAGGTAAQPPDQIAIELDSWTQYVERFILHFELRDAQKTAVLSVLHELKQRAIDHRDRHRQEIDSLERRIADYAGGEEELNELKSELAKLYGPVDEMFQELCRRAENVPTESQRAVAASKVDTKDKSEAKNRP